METINYDTADIKVLEYIDKFLDESKSFKSEDEVYDYADKLIHSAVDWVEENYNIEPSIIESVCNEPWYSYWDEWVHYVADDFIEKLDD